MYSTRSPRIDEPASGVADEVVPFAADDIRADILQYQTTSEASQTHMTRPM